MWNGSKRIDFPNVTHPASWSNPKARLNSHSISNTGFPPSTTIWKASFSIEKSSSGRVMLYFWPKKQQDDQWALHRDHKKKRVRVQFTNPYLKESSTWETLCSFPYLPCHKLHFLQQCYHTHWLHNMWLWHFYLPARHQCRSVPCRAY